MRRLVALGAAVAVLAGCGSGTARLQSDTEWSAHAVEVIDQFRQDEVLNAGSVTNVAAARHTLHDASALYGLLIAYTDFGGCRTFVDGFGKTLHFVRVVRTLRRACVRLERAAALFTRYASKNDPHALIAASREAQSAWPLLDRARLELALSRRS